MKHSHLVIMRRLTLAILGACVLLGVASAVALSLASVGTVSVTGNWTVDSGGLADVAGSSSGTHISGGQIRIDDGASEGTWTTDVAQYEYARAAENITVTAGGGWHNWSYQHVIASTDVANPHLIVDQDATYQYRVLVSNGTDNSTDVYGTKSLDGSWTKVSDDVGIDLDGDGTDEHTSGLDAGTRVNGTYYFTGDKWSSSVDLVKGDSLSSLQRVGDIGLNENSIDLYYNESSGVWHAIYESNPGAFGCCSGTKIGHATASSPTGPWTKHGAIFTTGGEYGTGDPEIIRVGDYYYVTVDTTTDHPYYHVGILRTRDLNATSYTFLGNQTTNYGGDADVRYDPSTDQFLMVNEYEKPTAEDIGLRLSPGPFNNSSTLSIQLGTDTDGEGTVDERTAYRTPTVDYSTGSDDQQKVRLTMYTNVSTAREPGHQVAFSLASGATVSGYRLRVAPLDSVPSAANPLTAFVPAGAGESAVQAGLLPPRTVIVADVSARVARLQYRAATYRAWAMPGDANLARADAEAFQAAFTEYETAIRKNINGDVTVNDSVDVIRVRFVRADGTDTATRYIVGNVSNGNYTTLTVVDASTRSVDSTIVFEDFASTSVSQDIRWAGQTYLAAGKPIPDSALTRLCQRYSAENVRGSFWSDFSSSTSASC